MNHFLDERPVRFEHLNAVVHAVANIQQAVVRKFGAMHRIAELLRRAAHLDYRGPGSYRRACAVGAPVAFVRAGLGVEHDDALVAVAVGDIQLVGLRIDEDLSRQPEILGVVAAIARAGLADLHQEFSILRELHDHAVVMTG